jgi:hypothetical protein
VASTPAPPQYDCCTNFFLHSYDRGLRVITDQRGLSKRCGLHRWRQSIRHHHIRRLVNSATANFNTPSNGGVMPWWGNASLAQQFATVVGSSLGTGFGPSGPCFAYGLGGGGVEQYSYIPTATPNVGAGVVLADLGGSVLPGSYYAQAVQLSPPAPAAAPGPLPVMGAAVAFSMSRRLRRRITAQPYKL